MIRICAVVDTFDVGGFELACLNLLTRLDPRRFQSSILTFRPGGLVERARTAGIPVVVGHDKPSDDRTWTTRDDRARQAWTGRLADEMTAFQTDLCMTWAWPEAIPAARASGVRAIVERIDGPALAGRVGDKSACVRVIVESRAARDILVVQREIFRLDPRRVVVIRNGIDLERFDPRARDGTAARGALGLPPDAFVAGTLARLAPEKNLGQLLAGFARAAATSHEFERHAWLVLAGRDAGSRDALQHQARELGVARRVVFTGEVIDQPGTLAAFDVFCLTSLTEGVPAALLEAMAMALPVIATPVGGVLEVLDGNALVVDLLAPLTTAHALLRLFDDRALCDRLGRRGHAIAQRSGISGQVRRYERVLEAAHRESSA